MNVNKYNVVCFGEILWDVLPSGARPGGAPMNVAFHLKKLGQNPATITRVGADERGAALKELLARQNISTDFIQEDAINRTGVVYAMPEDKGDVAYEIPEHAAWDFIEPESIHKALMREADYFIFGSLAARNHLSRNTLFSLIEMAGRKVMDVNLRAPHFNQKIITDLLSKADILKLNDDELSLITGWFSRHTGLSDRINQLQDRFKIPTLIVTCGADGAVIKHGDETYIHSGYKVEVADTVGSGDSFLAAFLSKTIDGATPSDALAFASAVGAMVASRAGAWPDYRPADIENMFN